MATLPEELVALRVSGFEKAGWLSEKAALDIPAGLLAWHEPSGRVLGPGSHPVHPDDTVILYREREPELCFRVADVVIDGSQLVQAEVGQTLCVARPDSLRNLINAEGELPRDVLYERGLPDLRLALTRALHKYGPRKVRDDPAIRLQAEHDLQLTLADRWASTGLGFPPEQGNGTAVSSLFVRVVSLTLDDDELAALRIREAQRRDLEEEMRALAGEALASARRRDAELKIEIERLQRALALEQAETARINREREEQDQRWCPIGEHHRPRSEMFECANPRCGRLVCTKHLDPRGRDDVSGRVCVDCGIIWREQQEQAAQGLEPCAECGRLVRHDTTFQCRKCAREWLCVAACLDPTRRMCVACVESQTPPAATASSTGESVFAAMQSLFKFAGDSNSVRIRPWMNTPTETTRGQTRNVAVVSKKDVAAFRTGDAISLSLTADRQCYVLLINVGPTGDTTILLPNKWRRSGLLRAGRTWVLPDPLMAADFQYRLEQPAGWETIIAIGTIQPTAFLERLPELGDERSFHFLPAGPQAADWLRSVAACLKSHQQASEWGLGSCRFHHSSVRHP